MKNELDRHTVDASSALFIHAPLPGSLNTIIAQRHMPFVYRRVQEQTEISLLSFKI